MKSWENKKNELRQEQCGINPWDALREVEYTGNGITKKDRQDIEKAADAEAMVMKLRELTDWRAKAEAEDPDGLAEAISADEQENLERRKKKQEIFDGIKRYRELMAGSKALLQRRKELLELQGKRTHNFGYRIKQKFGLHDSQMEKWDSELSQIEKQRQESIDLAYKGYVGNEDTIQARIDAIGDDTHIKEETFVNNFVTPLEKEQKRELLTFDNLAKLTTMEYLNLWKGLNPYYLSHVTRQGYRDHVGMVYHIAGKGEFHDNFKNIMNSDKKLHSIWESATGKGMSDVGDETAVDRYLQQETFLKNGVPESLQDGELDEGALAAALGGMHNIPNQPDGYWRDRTSVHFMANAIGDKFYGAEDDNEIFFIYPADVLASQCYTTTGLGSTEDYTCQKAKGLVPGKEANEHNDYSVMPRENGIPLDAGLVFLPKNILVNPENGSKYQTYDGENSVLASVENGGVRAEQYWEQYFTEHPESRPAHIIYYDGSPERAVRDLLKAEGIVVGGAGDLNDGSDLYDCGWGENITYGGTIAEQQVNQERKTFFERMAQYIKRRS